jgi:hypothetical protein
LKVSVSEIILFTAERLTFTDELKGSLKIPSADAIHLTCAATAGTAFFLTNDKNLVGKVIPDCNLSPAWIRTSSRIAADHRFQLHFHLRPFLIQNTEVNRISQSARVSNHVLAQRAFFFGADTQDRIAGFLIQ